MPAIAHILIAAAYSVVAVCVSIAVYQFTPYSLEISVIAGVAFALVCGQVHFISASRQKNRELESRLLTVRNEVRKTNQRAEIIETRISVMDETLSREVSERREAMVSEMRELETLILKLGKSFEARLARLARDRV